MIGKKTHDTARRFLAESRLTIRQASHTNGVVAHVRGDSGRICNCIARSDQCAHLIALKLITDEHEEEP
jgi:hypothetical protein